MVVAFSQDRKEGLDMLYVFRSYDHIHDAAESNHTFTPLNPGPAHHGPLWEVARATSAAPRYFESIKFMNRKFLDGGMGANKPGRIAYQEVHRMHGHPLALFVSIGTGVKRNIPKK